MRLSIRLLPLAAVLFSLFSSVALSTTIGDLYRFSYAFHDENWEYEGVEDIAYVTGTVNGTRVGDLLVDLSNPTLFINGLSTRPMFIKGHTDDLGYSRTPPVMSFHGYWNNFIIIDTDLAPHTSPSSVSQLFFQGVHGNISASGSGTGLSALEFNYLRWDYYPTFWTLELVSSQGAPPKVPDGGATLTLLGLASTALASLRRKFLAV